MDRRKLTSSTWSIGYTVIFANIILLSAFDSHGGDDPLSYCGLPQASNGFEATNRAGHRAWQRDRGSQEKLEGGEGALAKEKATLEQRIRDQVSQRDSVLCNRNQIIEEWKTSKAGMEFAADMSLEAS